MDLLFEFRPKFPESFGIMESTPSFSFCGLFIPRPLTPDPAGTEIMKVFFKKKNVLGVVI